MPSPILSVKNLSVSFDGSPVLENITFEVEQGEILAVIGPNGAGKTVLFRALIGAVPYSGEIHWADDVKIGYVPQKLDIDRNVPLSLKDFLNTKMRLSHETKSSLPEILGRVHLPQTLLHTRLGDLSSGQFQRALITYALIGRPKVLLFDEPTASVDFPREEQIYDMLHELQDAYGFTLILSSHDLNVVYRYASSVLCINKEMLCHGVPQDSLTPESLQKLYGAPALYHHNHGNH